MARSLLVVFAAAAGLSAAGCGDTSTSPSSAPPPAGAVVCEPGEGVVGEECAPAGFAACSDEGTCGEPTDCAPGSVGFLGTTACTVVGPAECPAGFARPDDGFGCEPIVATATCAGATRPRLGASSCVPVGNCTAAFPPAGATYFVDDSFTSVQVDATHFLTIQAAVAAAPAGATIAIEEGTYTAPVVLPKAVTLVGRCPAKVTLDGAAAAVPGLDVAKKIKVTLRGLTVTDFEVGVSAASGADVTIEDLVVEGNRRIGILAGDAGTKVLAKGVVVRGTRPDASNRFGLAAASGFEADMTIEDSALLDSVEWGASAQREGKIAVVRSVVSKVAQRAGNNAYGWGVGSQTGGQATVSESAIFDTFGGGVVAPDAGSKVRLERSYIRGVRTGPTANGGTIAAGVLAQGKGVAEVEGSTITGSARDGVLVGIGASAQISSSVIRDLEGSSGESAAINVTSDSSITIAATALVGATTNGILSGGKLSASDLFISRMTGAGVALRGTAKLERVIVADNQPGTGLENESFGAAIYSDDGATVDASDVIVRNSNGLGILSVGPGTKLSLLRALVVGTKAPVETAGYGLAAALGGFLSAENVAVVASQDAGIHVSDPGSSATLRGVAVLGTKPSVGEGRGRSINVQDAASVELYRVLTRGGAQVGLNVTGDGARAVVEDCVFSAVAQTDRGFGHGISVTKTGSLVMSHSVVSDNTGVGLVFSNASGSIARSIVRANPIGVHTQDGVSLLESATTPTELDPLAVVFTTDTRFEDNGSKVGSGAIPLPAPLKSAKPK
jgi:hypothetical protein